MAETESSYKYHVAFSFLSQDEALATEINDLLQDRLTTFLYSRRQGEVAGKDGEETFNKVFGEESRVVVILYRPGWGESRWTRIEQTAIKNRSLEHGYDFTIFIRLDKQASVPPWVPKNRIWLNLDRWGPKGAASAIEARVTDLGGEPHEETVKERAARLDRATKFRKHREEFLTNSKEAVAAANQEYDRLQQHLERLIADIEKSIPIRLRRYQEGIAITGLGLAMSVDWRCFFSLDQSKLMVAIWNRHPPYHEVSQFENPKRLSLLKFDFDLIASGAYVWRQDKTEREFGTEDLATFILKYYMNEDEAAKLKRSNKVDDDDD